MGFHAHGGPVFGYLKGTEEKPKVTRHLLMRVLRYALPYRWELVGMLIAILITTGLALLTPLILRNLIDKVIPSGNISQLVELAIALLMIPAISGFVNVFQRKWNSSVGEGVTYDLRLALYTHLERMSLRFFTNTKVGEMMSRLNNDVIGAQDAISTTIVGIITQIVQAVAVLSVMLTLEWRLTIISVLILPFFIYAARRLGGRLRDIARQQLEANAEMNAMLNETLNIGGALLVKLFGRRKQEVDRFDQRGSDRTQYWCSAYSDRYLVLCYHRLTERSWHCPGLWAGRLLRHQRRFYNRNNCRIWLLSGQPLQRFAKPGKCTSHVCHLSGQF